MRQSALNIWNAGLRSVLAQPLVTQAIELDNDRLTIGPASIDRRTFERILVVGGGKAASAMAKGLHQRLGDWLPMTGIVNVPEGTELPDRFTRISGIQTNAARPAGINEPTEAGVRGAQQMLDLLQQATEQDLAIVLISGGGSALMPLPIDGISLQDKIGVTRMLSGAGATIDELNTVRKHLSKLKGGGLLNACRAGQIITLVLSDVLGDPLDVIASGPTVTDPTTPHDALTVLKRYDPHRHLSPAIYRALERQAAAPTKPSAPPDRPHIEAHTIIIGNNRTAVDAAEAQAKRDRFTPMTQSALHSEGGAEAIGFEIADRIATWLRTPHEAQKHDCLIWGGEPTVKLIPPAQRGRGGRNQQLVLAAYQRLCQLGLTDQQWQRLTILSAGTDGEDGPTDAAGAVIDATTHRQAIAIGLSPEAYLRRNDAYTFFDATGGLIRTGPTGTNVCDLRVAIIRQ